MKSKNGNKMKRIKNAKIDDIFSRCIRESANWTCQKSGLEDPEGQAKGRSWGMQCCHIFGRRTVSMRWWPDNAICMNSRWHRYYTENPLLFDRFVRSLQGDAVIDALRERFNRKDIKYTDKDRREIYEYFEKTFQSMREMRLDGETGRIHINPYSL